MRILITGGAGFVGSSLARLFNENKHEVVCFDNLKRRGSELNLEDFKTRGIQFIHGDIRVREDLFQIPGKFDLLIEASAEPSVLAGLDGSPDYLIQTNLIATSHCLEYARRNVSHTVFLSTSRVYSIASLNKIKLLSGARRFTLDTTQKINGLTMNGINEDFSVSEARSIYGATKLASEYLFQEYVFNYGMKATINRCGVLAGPGQFGKVDQGVFTLWMANHYFKKTLKYQGYGGEGKQVRDILHPLDLYKAIELQLSNNSFEGEVYNISGGVENSISLCELTAYCRELTGNETIIDKQMDTSKVDVPWYIGDSNKAKESFQWKPQLSKEKIFQEIYGWIKNNESKLKSIF